MAFEPTKFKCKNCQDIIWSRYSGEFRVCKCWIETHEKVHQVTEKILNKLDAYIEVAFDDLQHCISCILMDEFGYGIAVDQTEHYIRQMGSDFDFDYLFGEDDE